MLLLYGLSFIIVCCTDTFHNLPGVQIGAALKVSHLHEGEDKKGWKSRRG